MSHSRSSCLVLIAPYQVYSCPVTPQSHLHLPDIKHPCLSFNIPTARSDTVSSPFEPIYTANSPRTDRVTNRPWVLLCATSKHVGCPQEFAQGLSVRCCVRCIRLSSAEPQRLMFCHSQVPHHLRDLILIVEHTIWYNFTSQSMPVGGLVQSGQAADLSVRSSSKSQFMNRRHPRRGKLAAHSQSYT